MSLTEQARHSRAWEGFPLLSEILRHGRLSIQWEAFSTASHTPFDEVHRGLTLYALVDSNIGHLNQQIKLLKTRTIAPANSAAERDHDEAQFHLVRLRAELANLAEFQDTLAKSFAIQADHLRSIANDA